VLLSALIFQTLIEPSSPSIFPLILELIGNWNMESRKFLNIFFWKWKFIRNKEHVIQTTKATKQRSEPNQNLPKKTSWEKT
jgi:hypothetical protein